MKAHWHEEVAPLARRYALTLKVAAIAWVVALAVIYYAR